MTVIHAVGRKIKEKEGKRGEGQRRRGGGGGKGKKRDEKGKEERNGKKRTGKGRRGKERLKRWLGKHKYEDWGSGPQNHLKVRVVCGLPIVPVFGKQRQDSRGKLAS